MTISSEKVTFIRTKIYNIEEIDTIIEAYGTKNSFKYFIGYDDNDVIRPLLVKLPQMTGYARNFNENKSMSFRVNHKQLLKNYNKIWKKIEELMNKIFESRPVYGDNDKCIKTK